MDNTQISTTCSIFVYYNAHRYMMGIPVWVYTVHTKDMCVSICKTGCFDGYKHADGLVKGLETELSSRAL